MKVILKVSSDILQLNASLHLVASSWRAELHHRLVTPSGVRGARGSSSWHGWTSQQVLMVVFLSVQAVGQMLNGGSENAILRYVGEQHGVHGGWRDSCHHLREDHCFLQRSEVITDLAVLILEENHVVSASLVSREAVQPCFERACNRVYFRLLE